MGSERLAVGDFLVDGPTGRVPVRGVQHRRRSGVLTGVDWMRVDRMAHEIPRGRGMGRCSFARDDICEGGWRRGR